jgi:hypothetical protein
MFVAIATAPAYVCQAVLWYGYSGLKPCVCKCINEEANISNLYVALGFSFITNTILLLLHQKAGVDVLGLGVML